MEGDIAKALVKIADALDVKKDINNLHLAVTQSRGQMEKLETVVRMSLSSQEKFNDYVKENMDRHRQDHKEDKKESVEKCRHYDKRISGIERKWAYLSGAVAVITVIFMALLKYWR